MLGLLAAIVILFLILLVNSILHKKDQMKPTLKLNLMRILGYVVVALATGGVAPSIQIYTGALVCKGSTESTDLLFEPTSECYKGIHFLYIFLFAIAFFIHLGMIKVSTHMFLDPNPLSKEPYARPKSSSFILGTLPGLIIPISTVLDYPGNIRIYTVMVLCSIYICDAILSLKLPDFSNRSSALIFGVADSLKISIYIGVILNYYFNKSDSFLHVVLYILALKIGIRSSITLFKSRIQEKILTKNFRLIANKDDILMVIFTLLKLSFDFTNQFDNSSFVRLQGYLSLQRQLFIDDPTGQEIWLYLTTFGNYDQIKALKVQLSEQKQNKKLLLSKIENLSDEEELVDDERRKFTSKSRILLDDETPLTPVKASSMNSIDMHHSYDQKNDDSKQNAVFTVTNAKTQSKHLNAKNKARHD